VPDAGVGEQVGEIVPEPDFGVVAVRVLQPFYGADGFHTLGERLQPIETLREGGQILVGAPYDRDRGERDRRGHTALYAQPDHVDILTRSFVE
jgi:hypothetical protein